MRLCWRGGNPSMPNLAAVSQCPQHSKFCELGCNGGLLRSAVCVSWDSVGQSQEKSDKMVRSFHLPWTFPKCPRGHCLGFRIPAIPVFESQRFRADRSCCVKFSLPSLFGVICSWLIFSWNQVGLLRSLPVPTGWQLEKHSFKFPGYCRKGIK